MLTIIKTAETVAAININAAPIVAAPVVAEQNPTFEAGKTYWTRSVCDSDCIFKISVERRTAKTLITTQGKRLKVYAGYDGAEYVMPHGRYSMAAIISADKVLIA
jgi:hypothetical protein|tara:strand:- start:2565 stop:2879 length:315 start_codon:yes stop_codon:yes gene_type:complete